MTTRKQYANNWIQWKADFKKNRPVVYWLTEILPRKVADWFEDVEDLGHDIRAEIDNFFVHRFDIFRTGVKRWQYADTGDLFLPANFNQLVNYVEIRLAQLYISRQAYDLTPGADVKSWKKLHGKMRHYPYFHFKRYRNREYGLEYIHNGIKDVDTVSAPYPQDENHIIHKLTTILSLYIWWTDVRPNRGVSDDICGLTEFRDQMTAKYPEWSFMDLDTDEKAEYTKLLLADDLVLEAWEKEDTEMLLKLIKERHNIWN